MESIEYDIHDIVTALTTEADTVIIKTGPEVTQNLISVVQACGEDKLIVLLNLNFTDDVVIEYFVAQFPNHKIMCVSEISDIDYQVIFETDDTGSIICDYLGKLCGTVHAFSDSYTIYTL